MDRKFAIDSNILILCHRQVYPFEIAPGFWRQLIEKGDSRIILLDKVKEEISKNEDQLSEWIKDNENAFIIKEVDNPDIIRCYTKIITSVKENEIYRETAKSEFASIADSWLCAYAMAYGDIIVSNEKLEPNSKKKVKIPNICQKFDIKYIGLLQFMKELDIRFD